MLFIQDNVFDLIVELCLIDLLITLKRFTPDRITRIEVRRRAVGDKPLRAFGVLAR